MADTRWLEQRRQGWYTVVEVPPSARAALGKRRLVKSLGTRDLNVARARRWAVLNDLRGQIEAARRGQQADPVMAEALGWREALDDAKAGRMLGVVPGDEGEDPEAFVRSLAAERAEELAHRGTPDLAQTFYGLATGVATPLTLHLETWLFEGGNAGPFRERTKGDHRRAVAELAAWLGREQIGATVEAVTRMTAGRFMSECLLRSGRAPKTIAKTVSSLSSFWRWLAKRGHVSESTVNPWKDQAPPKRSHNGAPGEEERAFSDAEVVRLLANPPDQTIGDFMRTAALTGMRREEIGRLTVADCEDGVFTVRRGKTAAAARRVPIHSELVPMVTRRCAGKAGPAFLFDDLRSERAERTDAIGKQFTRYRRSLGIQDGEGRRSLVNFHSFRRWWVTAAINAGQPPHIVSTVVGHEEGRRGMTLGRYL